MMTKAQIMKRAWEIKREDSRYVFGLCLKMAWAEAKASNATVTIRTEYHGFGSRCQGYKDEVLEGTLVNGALTFDYPVNAEWEEPTAKTNKVKHVTFKIESGIYALNGKVYGVDLANVTEITGRTYSVKGEAKAAGMKWNGAQKCWAR